MQEGNYGQAPVYFIEVDGEECKLQSKSKKLARRMDSIAEGTEIRVTRDGEGTSTKYVVEVK